MSRRLRRRDRLVSHGVTMRVAIITESFPPDVNGVAHCVLRVAELLSSGGHHPLVIAPEPGRCAAAQLLTRYDARRISANIAKLPEVLRKV